jgi:hypothetical protein
MLKAQEEDDAITEKPPVPPQEGVVRRVSQTGQRGISLATSHENSD